MAKFEHKRYPALVLQDEAGIWARFTPETREFGEHKITVGVLETSDAKVIKRLREATDDKLVEVGDADSSKDKAVTVPDGDPSDAWTVDQLKAYAEKEEIGLGAARAKADVLAAIETALADR